MGISGLLPFLKNATRQTNIKEFRGQTVAVDSYCWLHKGAFSCADKLALGENTEQYVYYCMKYVNTLLSYDIKPVMVFDGCHLPSKKDVEISRRERRDAQRKKAALLLREGKRSEARDALRLSIDISSDMALNLMNACRNKGVDCIVAPYEADAQLAYLNKVGIAQVIITEDSDLVLFGCERVMYKMDFNGNGLLVESSQLNKTMDLRADLYSFEKFRYMCILSGCDYLPSLRGVGLKKAMSVFQLTRNTDMNIVLKRLPTTLNLNNVTVGPDYIEGFFRADNTFLYQLVYDPMKRRLVPLNPYPEGVDKEDLQYAGPYLDEYVAYQLALGNLDVHNKREIADFDPDSFVPKSNKWERDSRLHRLSIWNKTYRPMSKIAANSRNTHEIQRMCTKGKDVAVKMNLKLPSKKSPLKRARDAEDDVAVPTENELANMYGNYNNSTKEFQESPAKRRKSDHNSTPSALKTNADEQMLNVLSELIGEDDHEQETRDMTETANVTTPADCKTETKKKQISKNMFKVSSSGPKDNFKLNAAKTEVVSRFFSKSNKPFQKTKFFSELDDTTPDKKPLIDPHKVFMHEDSQDPVHISNDELKTEAMSSDSVEDTENKGSFFSQEDTLPRNNSSSQFSENSNSPLQRSQGSFNFKSKLNKFQSNFSKDTKENWSLKSSDSSCKQFKPVIVDKSKLSKRDSIETDYENSTERKNIESFSQSSLYSIDGESFGSSQNNSEAITDNMHLPDLNENTSTLGDRTSPAEQLTPPLPNMTLMSIPQCELTSKLDCDNSKSVISTSLQSGVNSQSKTSQSLFSKLQPVKKISFYQRQSMEGSEESNKTKDRNQGSNNLTSKSGETTKTKLAGCRSSGLKKNSKQGKANVENQSSIKNFFTSFNYSKETKAKMGNLRSPLSSKQN